MFDGKLINLKVEDILQNGEAPLRRADEYNLKKLSDSIRENGILQPLTVRSAGGGKYFLIAGTRRLSAARLAGLKKVPCIIRRADDITADIFALSENLRQEKLTAFEEAEGIMHIMTDHGLTLEEVAGRLGIASSALAEKLELLSLDDELITRLTAARLTERHAAALLRAPKDKRKEVLDFILANQLTLTETEHYVEGLLAPKNAEPMPRHRCAIGDLRLFTNSLYKLTETLQKGGVNATVTRQDSETHTAYTVIVPKG